MKRIYVVLLSAVALTGAVSCGSHLPTYYYLIETGPEVTKAEEVISLKVDVNPVRAPDRYLNRIVFRRGPFEVGFYEYSQWVELPAAMVRRALINALNESELFGQVDLIGSDPAADLDLNSEIESFDQVIEEDEWYAAFDLILEFNRHDTGAPVWSYRTGARVKQKGEGELAAAMSEAVSRALVQAVSEMEQSEELRKLPDTFAEEKIKSETRN
ncbi:MAG: ABC-type transport auxiliary lipoprotein family protein [PVC group bacterium]